MLISISDEALRGIVLEDKESCTEEIEDIEEKVSYNDWTVFKYHIKQDRYTYKELFLTFSNIKNWNAHESYDLRQDHICF